MRVWLDELEDGESFVVQKLNLYLQCLKRFEGVLVVTIPGEG